jgi:hypothetical protein
MKFKENNTTSKEIMKNKFRVLLVIFDDVKNIVNTRFGVDPQLAIALGLIDAIILRDASDMSIDDIITDLQKSFNQAQTVTSPIILYLRR